MLKKSRKAGKIEITYCTSLCSGMPEFGTFWNFYSSSHSITIFFININCKKKNRALHKCQSFRAEIAKCAKKIWKLIPVFIFIKNIFRFEFPKFA